MLLRSSDGEGQGPVFGKAPRGIEIDALVLDDIERAVGQRQQVLVADPAPGDTAAQVFGEPTTRAEDHLVLACEHASAGGRERAARDCIEIPSLCATMGFGPEYGAVVAALIRSHKGGARG